jgi:hypothetical protein
MLDRATPVEIEGTAALASDGVHSTGGLPVWEKWIEHARWKNHAADGE